MQKDQTHSFDDTGKVVFDDHYNQPDPRAYFEHLGALGYRIAGEAQPLIGVTIEGLKEARNLSKVKIADVGSSYGINSALMKGDLTLDDLSDHYRSPLLDGMSAEEVLKRDTQYYRDHLTDTTREVVGLDVSEKAIAFAVNSGALDEGIARNLEEESLTPTDIAKLRGTDLIVSTGAIGYVTEKTFEQVLDATSANRPWIANCVLRMFPYESYEKFLAERGYVTEKLPTTLKQRRFATREEQENVLANLKSLGLDPTGLESEGTYHAEFFLSRPKEEAGKEITLP